MRFPTWLRFAVPVDGVYWREAPSEPPRRREPPSNRPADSYNLPEKAPHGAATSGVNNKWIYVR